MGLEIERKFLVKGDYKPFVKKSSRMLQGYLNSVPDRSVRIRVVGRKGLITVKGDCNESGTSRFEWEKEIPVSEAKELLKICEPGYIEKIRHYITVGKHTFEIDEFLGDNKGLVIAEVELSAEDEQYEKPDWLGDEVTGSQMYYNAFLSKNPFKQWKFHR